MRGDQINYHCSIEKCSAVCRYEVQCAHNGSERGAQNPCNGVGFGELRQSYYSAIEGLVILSRTPSTTCLTHLLRPPCQLSLMRLRTAARVCSCLMRLPRKEASWKPSKCCSHLRVGKPVVSLIFLVIDDACNKACDGACNRAVDRKRMKQQACQPSRS